MAAAFSVRYRSVHSVAPTFSGRMMPLVGQILMATVIGSSINLREYVSGSRKQASSSLASASNCFSAYRSNNGINSAGSCSRRAFELMLIRRQNAARPLRRSAPASSPAALILASACLERGGSSITENHSTFNGPAREGHVA